MNKLNENIKNFRTFRNITQQDLAEKLGKSKSVISNWERGENSPNPEEVEAMCRLFKVTPNEIYGWENNKEYDQYQKELIEFEARIEILKGEKIMLEKKIEDIDRKILEEQKILNDRRTLDD